MQFKPIAAIIVLLLVIASLAFAGCTTKVPIETAVEIGGGEGPRNISPAYPTSGHSQLVQGSIDYYRDQRWPFDTYTVKWINDTQAQTSGIEKSGEGTSFNIMTVNTTYTHFPTVEAASAYFDSLRSQYPKKSDSISEGVKYYEITGKLATVTKELKTEWIGDHFPSYLTQQDALITQRSFTFEYPNKPTNQA